MMIDIAMLTCNRARITETAIRELAARTTTPYRLIVLDNGSADNSTDMLAQLYVADDIVDKFYVSTENNGVHWGFNKLLELATGPLYICTDNDIIPPVPIEGIDWLARLLALAEQHPEYAAIACRPHVMIGDNAERMFQDSPPVQERGHVGAVLRLMRTEAVREVGGWKKEKRPSRNNEEWYICGQLRKAGWKVGYSRDIRVIHLFGEGKCEACKGVGSTNLAASFGALDCAECGGTGGEDPWGYPLGVEHGHVERWPPVNRYSWERMGIDWGTCK